MPKQVPTSSFLSSAKPHLKTLVERLSQHFAYASVLGTDVMGKNYGVTSKATSISDGSWGERGFVARVYKDGRYFEYAFNQLDAIGVDALATKITASADNKDSDAFIYPEPKEDNVTWFFQETAEILPSEVSPDKIISRLTDINRNVREASPLVVEANVRLGYAKISKIFISANKDLEQHYMWAEAYIIATTRRGDNTRTGYKSFAGLKGLEILSELEDGVDMVVQNACKLLDAGPMPPGEYDVICNPDAVGIIVHEAFGHGVELDMFLKNRANAAEYMNKSVASPLVQMHDGASSVRNVSSYMFDDEGNLGCDTVVIKDGILTAGISDALSAAQLGLKPTGNGKRQTYANKAYSRMTNTFFKSGTDKLEDMIASIKHGYLIEDAASGMEDPKDWGIQCMFNYAREIVDGKVTDNWVTPVVMTGYVPDLLKSITMMSDDFDFSAAGGCGKGYKEWVKVSCGGPYIKTRARLG